MPRLQRPASRIRTLSTAAPARGLDVEIYDDICENSCPVSVLAHLLPTGPICSLDFSGTCSLTSDPWRGSATRPVSPLWTPAREAACSDLRENWNAPKNTCHPGFVENCHLSTFLRDGVQRSESYVFYSTARVMCTAVAAVMERRMYCQRWYERYILHTLSTSAAQRATYTYVCNLQQKV